MQVQVINPRRLAFSFESARVVSGIEFHQSGKARGT